MCGGLALWWCPGHLGSLCAWSSNGLLFKLGQQLLLFCANMTKRLILCWSVDELIKLKGWNTNPTAQILKNMAAHSVSSQLAVKLFYFHTLYSHFYIHIEPHALLFLAVKR